MKNRKRLLALLLSLALTVSLCACGSGLTYGTTNGDPSDSVAPSLDPGASPDPGAEPSIEADLDQGALEFAAGLSPTDILLTVNGEDVQADLFCYMLEQACSQTRQYLSYFGMSLSDIPDMAGDLLEQGVDWSVYHIVIRQKAAELGCLLTDSQTAEVNEAMDDPDLTDQADYWELTGQTLRFILELNSYYENLLDAVTHEPSEQELKEYLDDQGIFYVKHILLKTTDGQDQPLSDEEIAGKKTLADDLLAQLRAAEDMPAKFDELMHAYSEDPGVATNPDGYVFGSSDSLVGGFREAALELEEGQLSGIVETDYGYHIMLRLALTDEMVESYRSDFRLGTLEDQIDQWMEAAEIVRADALTNLDVLDFYTRLTAYQDALYLQRLDEEEAVG